MSRLLLAGSGAADLHASSAQMCEDAQFFSCSSSTPTLWVVRGGRGSSVSTEFSGLFQATPSLWEMSVSQLPPSAPGPPGVASGVWRGCREGGVSSLAPLAVPLSPLVLPGPRAAGCHEAGGGRTSGSSWCSSRCRGSPCRPGPQGPGAQGAALGLGCISIKPEEPLQQVLFAGTTAAPGPGPVLCPRWPCSPGARGHPPSLHSSGALSRWPCLIPRLPQPAWPGPAPHVPPGSSFRVSVRLPLRTRRGRSGPACPSLVCLPSPAAPASVQAVGGPTVSGLE